MLKRVTWAVLVSLLFTSSYSAAQSLPDFGASSSQRPSGAKYPSGTLLPSNPSLSSSQTFMFAGRTYPAMQALTKPIDPESYTIGPGDGLVVQIWGGVDLLYEVIVSAEGKLVIPTIGTVEVKGKRLNEVQELVAREAAHYYRGANVAVTLAVLRSFELFVLGEVNRPGVYPATPVTRVTELIDQAGGIAPSGSPRRVEIRRAGGEVAAVNLSRFLEDGVLEENPYVTDGSTLYVPLNAGTAVIEGAVRRPGTYKLVAGDTVQSLIAAAGGLTAEAAPGQMRLDHAGLSSAQSASSQSAPDQSGAAGGQLENQPVRDGDRLTIPRKDGGTAPYPVIENQVYVVGHVKNPGPVLYVRNRSVMDYIGLAGGGDDRANMAGVTVQRRQEQLAMAAVEAVQPGDMIVVPEKTLKWWQDYVAILVALTGITSVVLSAVAVSVASHNN
jgi:protein involved in polysaccharide export with SLBB domain